MDHVFAMQVVDGSEDLLDGLRGILFCEFALLADTIEKLAASCQFRHDVVLVLFVTV